MTLEASGGPARWVLNDLTRNGKILTLPRGEEAYERDENGTATPRLPSLLRPMSLGQADSRADTIEEQILPLCVICLFRYRVLAGEKSH